MYTIVFIVARNKENIYAKVTEEKSLARTDTQKEEKLKYFTHISASKPLTTRRKVNISDGKDVPATLAFGAVTE